MQFQLCASTITRMLDLMEQPALGSEDAAAVVTLVDRMVEAVSYRWGPACCGRCGSCTLVPLMHCFNGSKALQVGAPSHAASREALVVFRTGLHDRLHRCL